MFDKLLLNEYWLPFLFLLKLAFPGKFCLYIKLLKNV